MIVYIAASRDKVVLLRDAIAGALAELPGRPDQLSVIHHDRSYGPRVQDSILSEISKSDAIVADLSGERSKVLFELGLAIGERKPVVLLAEDTTQVPSELRHLQIVLTPSSPSESFLAGRLRDAFQEILPQFKQLTSQPQQPTQKQLFISYSHADREYIDRILVHLGPLVRSGLVQVWADTQLKAGDRWREEIRTAVESAGVAVLAISADFLNSEFIQTNELPPLLAAADERGARIIPVIAKPSRFIRDHRLSRFHAINDPNQPLIGMTELERERLYARLAEEIELELEF